MSGRPGGCSAGARAARPQQGLSPLNGASALELGEQSLGLGGGRLHEREGAQTPDLRPRMAQRTHSERVHCALLPQKAVLWGRGWKGGAPALAPAWERWGPRPGAAEPHPGRPSSPEVTPTSGAVWGWGSCRSLTLRRLILMAWRRRGGRRWEWERSVAMVAALPFPSACPRWVKIAKPQDYAKSPGPPPCARGGGRRVGRGTGRAFITSEAPAPSSLWPPGQDPGRDSPGLEAEGGLSGRVRPHPTPPSLRGPEAPQQGVLSRPGGGLAPSQALHLAGLGTEQPPLIGGVLAHRLPRMGPRPGVGVGLGEAQGEGSRGESPCLAGPQPTAQPAPLHRSHSTKVTGTSYTRWGRPYGSCPHKDRQKVAPLKCPCCQPRRCWAGLPEEEAGGGRCCLFEGALVHKGQESGHFRAWLSQSSEACRHRPRAFLRA